ncbi:MAG: acyl-CoA reductase [Terrimicrobiaceae bacterium]|nr:acyl-CoA reductase [Terrimicrobiaceae bacterium]
MTTAERARALAEAATGFPELGPPTAEDLLETLRLELGDAEALDRFCSYGKNLAIAVAPERMLHIVSGNTPHAAFQTMLRGLLLGAMNWVKFPSERIECLEDFGSRLPPGLRERLVIQRTLPGEWIAEADAWVVYGSDATVAHFRALCPPGRIFQAHGHRVGIGVIFEDGGPEVLQAAACDVALFDQLGCLSAQVVYVAGDAVESAQRLGEALEEFTRLHPPEEIPLGAREAIASVRELARFDEARGTGVQLFASSDSLTWTVIHDPDPSFRFSPGFRVVFVKPVPPDWMAALAPVRGQIGAIGIHPGDSRKVAELVRLRPSRICPLGRMQDPPFAWHAEGRPNLGDLVHWVDFERGAC